MCTEAQIRANQLNAQHSTGPTSEEGKAASCMNNFRWGFTAVFSVLPSEDQDEFDLLFHGLSVEHQVKTMTERVLVLKMAQHHWLSLRAQRLQDAVMGDDLPAATQERQFNLYLRYQTTNDRAFSRCLNDLLKLRAERRKPQLDEAALLKRAENVKIGFESQKQKEAELARRQSIETRKQEVHKFDVLLAEAKLDHQLLQNMNLEIANRNAAGREIHPLEAQQAA